MVEFIEKLLNNYQEDVSQLLDKQQGTRWTNVQYIVKPILRQFRVSTLLSK